MRRIVFCARLGLQLVRIGAVLFAAALLLTLAKAIRLFNCLLRVEQLNAWLVRFNERLQSPRRPKIGLRRDLLGRSKGRG